MNRRELKNKYMLSKFLNDAKIFLYCIGICFVIGVGIALLMLYFAGEIEITKFLTTIFIIFTLLMIYCYWYVNNYYSSLKVKKPDNKASVSNTQTVNEKNLFY